MEYHTYKSKVNHPIGTVLVDDDTKEQFIVISCIRIGILDDYNFGIKVKMISPIQ